MLVTNFHIKYFLYKLIHMPFQLFDVASIHPSRERAIRALKKTVDYIDEHMPDAMTFTTQRELMRYSLKQVEVEGCFMEFGVYKGGTMRYMAKRRSDRLFHGFDSFEGLPESWGGFDLPRGAFNTKGNLPKVPNNVSLHKGWYNKALPTWKTSCEDKIAFMHVDCDLYSSTKTIFDELADRLQVGTVILFDEYFNYPNWENHEFKAWKEYVTQHGISYEYLGFARQQVAIKITSMGTN